MRDWLDHLATPLGDALRVIRLRIDRPRSVSGRWIHITVRHRAEKQRQQIESAKRFRMQKPWQPGWGRESPREVLMDGRRFWNRYAYPGWMAINTRRREKPVRPLYSCCSDSEIG